MSKLKRPRRRGAAMIEFGLGFGIFMMFFIATIEGGRLMWSWASLAHATREGARYAMVHGKASPVSDSAIGAKVEANALGLDDEELNVTTSWSDALKVRGSQVTLDSTYDFRFVVTGLTSDNTIRLRSRSTVTVAN